MTRVTVSTKGITNPDVRFFEGEGIFSNLKSSIVHWNHGINSSELSEVDLKKAKLLLSLPGVTSAFLYPNKVTLEKAPLFGWDFLEPFVIKILQGESIEETIPSVSAHISYRRYATNQFYVEFNTTFVVCKYEIVDLYPSWGDLESEEKLRKAGPVGINIAKAVFDIDRKNVDHFNLSPYCLDVVTELSSLTDNQCKKIQAIIADVGEKESCVFSELPKVFLQPSDGRYPPWDDVDSF